MSNNNKKVFIPFFNKYLFYTFIRQALLDVGDTSVNEMNKNTCPHGDK